MTREQAIKDSLAIWKDLAITGSPSKEDTVKKLFRRGMISREAYFHACPLCTLFNYANAAGILCPECPWVGDKDPPHVRCELPSSPYEKWRDVRFFWSEGNRRIRLQQAASKVYKLIKTFE